MRVKSNDDDDKITRKLINILIFAASKFFLRLSIASKQSPTTKKTSIYVLIFN